MAKKKEKQVWIIGRSCTDNNGVIISKYLATKKQIKKKIANMIREDKGNDPENFDSGSTAMKDLEEDRDGVIERYAAFNYYYIDYTAYPDKDIEVEEL